MNLDLTVIPGIVGMLVALGTLALTFNTNARKANQDQLAEVRAQFTLHRQDCAERIAELEKQVTRLEQRSTQQDNEIHSLQTEKVLLLERLAAR